MAAELDSLVGDIEEMPSTKGDVFNDEHSDGMLWEKVSEEGKKQAELEIGARFGARIDDIVGETRSKTDPKTGRYQDKDSSIKHSFSNCPMQEAPTQAGGLKRKVDEHLDSDDYGSGSNEPAPKRVLTAAIAESIASSPTLTPEQQGSGPETIVGVMQDPSSPPEVKTTTELENPSGPWNASSYISPEQHIPVTVNVTQQSPSPQKTATANQHQDLARQQYGTETPAPRHRKPNKSKFEQMKREAATKRQADSDAAAGGPLSMDSSEDREVFASPKTPSLLKGALNKLASNGVITTNIGNVSGSDAPGTTEAHQKVLAKKKEEESLLAAKKIQEEIEAARKEDEALEAARKAEEEREAAAEAEARAKIARTPISKRFVDSLIPEDPNQSAVIRNECYGRSEPMNVDDETDSIPWGSPGTKPYIANAAQYSLNHRQDKVREARSAKKKAIGGASAK